MKKQFSYEVKREFVSAWKTFGSSGHFEEVLNLLSACYTEEHREYHDARHVGHCFHEFWQYNDTPSTGKHVSEREAATVRLFIMFHDAVYDPHRTDSEERSAELAKGVLQLSGADKEVVNEVVSLIRFTKYADVPKTEMEKLVSDLDLTIFGQETDSFDWYEEGIRKEYGHVPEAEFKTKRAKILQSFLDRPTIYFTEYFRNKYEALARENLKRSVAKLTDQVVK
jgi:predicted metal-dependent HD superfamily phosphohydrolase